MAILTSKDLAIVEKEDRFTSLKDVKGESDRCIVKVKVMIMWKTFFNENLRSSSSLEMILIDEQGYKIMAMIKKADLKTFEIQLKEGGFYIISNFRVASYSSTPKLVDHVAKINFFQNTILEATDDFTATENEFNFVDYDDANHSRVNKDLAFDVVGRLISSNDMKIFKSKGKDKSLLTCELQNLSGERVGYTLWGDYATKVHKFIKHNHSSNDPIVVFLHFAKFNDYKGIDVNEDSFCTIAADSDLAGLLMNTELIIWDEAPMMHRHCFEAFERTLRDIVDPESSNKPFGMKVIVFGGDFRQVLPVITKGRRQDIVNASLNSSYIWQYCSVLRLTENMRLKAGTNKEEAESIKDFADWILQIGDDSIRTYNTIQVPTNTISSPGLLCNDDKQKPMTVFNQCWIVFETTRFLSWAVVCGRLSSEE